MSDAGAIRPGSYDGDCSGDAGVEWDGWQKAEVVPPQELSGAFGQRPIRKSPADTWPARCWQWRAADETGFA
jgi:hypothetical protein